MEVDIVELKQRIRISDHADHMPGPVILPIGSPIGPSQRLILKYDGSRPLRIPANHAGEVNINVVCAPDWKTFAGQPLPSPVRGCLQAPEFDSN